MVKAVIFDVDGTLVDSVDLHAQAWQDAFRDFGHKIELKAIRNQIGKGGPTSSRFSDARRNRQGRAGPRETPWRYLERALPLPDQSVSQGARTF